jgi:hypothetical protein
MSQAESNDPYQENNGDNCITAKFVQIAPKILASQKEINCYLKNCSMDEVDSIEYWAIQLRKRCRQIWSDKRFPREKEAFFEMYRQRKQNQIMQN